MTEEEIRNSILLLRQRREAIPTLREYKPQRGTKAAPAASKPVEDIFSDLFAAGENMP